MIRIAIVFGLLMLGENSARASCLASQSPLSPENIAQFKASPEMLLQRYPSGGGGLVADVREMVTSDVSTLDGVVKIAKDAVNQQKFAIGAALGQSLLICRTRDIAAAQSIQEAIAGLGDSDVEVAFLSASGQRAVGSIAAGGGAVAGAVGGGAFAGPVGSFTDGPGGLLPGGSVAVRQSRGSVLTGDDGAFNAAATRRRGTSVAPAGSGVTLSVSP